MQPRPADAPTVEVDTVQFGRPPKQLATPLIPSALRCVEKLLVPRKGAALVDDSLAGFVAVAPNQLQRRTHSTSIEACLCYLATRKARLVAQV